jgi:biopolymer transport protein ExbD
MKLSLRAKAEPEVNMTSLIDVVLLLLIFFMVSTSFVKQSQISIRLPEAQNATIVEEVPEQLDVMITEQGTFLINGRELINNRPETIRNALQKVSGGDLSRRWLVHARLDLRFTQGIATAIPFAPARRSAAPVLRHHPGCW